MHSPEVSLFVFFAQKSRSGIDSENRSLSTCLCSAEKVFMFAAILQPFVLIALGAVLSRMKMFPRPLWGGVEKLVYYVLLPPLLFNSIANAELTVSQTSLYLAVGAGTMASGILYGWIASKITPVDRVTDASLRQCAYRFNSYIGFAIVLSLYGQTGMALFALLMGVWVPISNSVAVADIASAASRSGGSFSNIVKSILKNPLIIATLSGMVFNIFGLSMPELVTGVFNSLGAASLAPALMTIGSSLKADDFRRYRSVLCSASAVRLLLVPATGLAASLLLGLTAVETGALMSLVALPTANSCYILAVRLGGNGHAVADLTTVQTALALITIPVWMWIVQTVCG